MFVVCFGIYNVSVRYCNVVQALLCSFEEDTKTSFGCYLLNIGEEYIGLIVLSSFYDATCPRIVYFNP